MNAAIGALPPVLYEPSQRRVPPGLESVEINELRKKGRVWAGVDLSRLSRNELIATVRKSARGRPERGAYRSRAAGAGARRGCRLQPIRRLGRR